jgi:RNA-directed DNA polymerase
MNEGKSFEITKHQVLNAYKRVKANRGAGGIDGVELDEFEKKMKNNLYKLWNRMVSGSYFPKAVRGVEIPKKNGKKRLLGIPTIEDRIAQMVVRMSFEPKVEPIFSENSYGYRPNKSAIDAVGKTRERCFRMAWVIEFDIVGLFDNINHELLMKAVEKHTDIKWERLYIKRFLTAPIQMPDGTLQERTSGTPQGGVISPILANLYYALCV